MKAFAAFVMRGRLNATLSAVTLMVMALMLTPLSIVSAAIIALVTLRHGAWEGFLITLMSSLVLSGMGILLIGQPLAMLLMGLMLWLPMWGLGWLFRITRSLRYTVEASVIGGLLLIVGQYLVFDDPAAFWATQLETLFQPLTEGGAINEQDQEIILSSLGPWMVGGLATAWFMQLVLSVFLARSWQAKLYNPGGFDTEFKSLRLGKWLLLVVPVVLIAGLAGKEEPGILAHFSLIGMGAFFFQGISLVHGLVDRLKSGSAWLIGFYILLVVGMPPSFTAVSAAGYADGWLDFRRKLQPKETGNDE